MASNKPTKDWEAILFFGFMYLAMTGTMAIGFWAIWEVIKNDK